MSVCAYALIHYAGRYAQLAQESAETWSRSSSQR